MITCPKCSGHNCVKDGIVKKRQRYRCKICNYRHTVQHRGKRPELRRQALELYLEGMGFRSIGRFLKCSHVTVCNWIKSFGKSVDEIRSESTIKVMRIDEMHTCIATKKTVADYGLLLIDMKKDASTAYWVIEDRQQVKSCGVNSTEKRLGMP